MGMPNDICATCFQEQGHIAEPASGESQLSN